ncbi:MAG: alpha-E domain-containing protein [Bradymonadia bacterium]
MISRVAEHCVWLMRHVERAESAARMLMVNRALVPGEGALAPARWHPLVIAAGEEDNFIDRFSRAALNDGEQVQAYLTWDKQCAVSLRSAIFWARENARHIRETLTLEMWESLNVMWLWLTEGEARALYDAERHRMYEQVREGCQQFHGALDGTLPRTTAYQFMQLGKWLERGGQTARLLDVHHYVLHRDDGLPPSPLEAAKWQAVLRSCSAHDALLKVSRKPFSGRSIAQFLMLDPHFPRSIRYCLERALETLKGIHPEEGPHLGASTRQRLGTLVGDLTGRSIDEHLDRGLQHSLTDIIDRTAMVFSAVQQDYFEPPIDLSTPLPPVPTPLADLQ